MSLARTAASDSGQDVSLQLLDLLVRGGDVVLLLGLCVFAELLVRSEAHLLRLLLLNTFRFHVLQHGNDLLHGCRASIERVGMDEGQRNEEPHLE